MLAPPTDRLHKFLAISGIALIALGVAYALQQYHEAELKRIEAFEKSMLAGAAYNRYAQKVNEQTLVYRQALSQKLTDEQVALSKEKIRGTLPALEILDREVQDALIHSRAHIETAMHYQTMRNIWFALSVAMIIGGTCISVIGFAAWLRQPKSKR